MERLGARQGSTRAPTGCHHQDWVVLVRHDPGEPGQELRDPARLCSVSGPYSGVWCVRCNNIAHHLCLSSDHHFMASRDKLSKELLRHHQDFQESCCLCWSISCLKWSEAQRHYWGEWHWSQSNWILFRQIKIFIHWTGILFTFDSCDWGWRNSLKWHCNIVINSGAVINIAEVSSYQHSNIFGLCLEKYFRLVLIKLPPQLFYHFNAERSKHLTFLQHLLLIKSNRIR